MDRLKRRDWSPLDDHIDVLYMRQVALGVLLGSIWKLVALTWGLGEPYASLGGAFIGVSTVLTWELVARRLSVARLTPSVLVLAVGSVAPVVLLTLDGGFHIGSGSFSCGVYIVLAAMILLGPARSKK